MKARTVNKEKLRMDEKSRVTPEVIRRYCCLDEVDPALDKLLKLDIARSSRDGFFKGLALGIAITASAAAILLSVMGICIL